MLADLQINTVLIKSEINKTETSPERISTLAENWGKSFNEVFYNFSQKKYIFTKSINSKYSVLIGQLIKMNSYVKAEKELSLLYITIDNGNVEFMGDEEERNLISDKLNKLNKEEIMTITTDTISILQSEIQRHFKEMK